MAQERTETLTVRVTPRERRLLRELAHQREQSLSSYIRAAALKTAVEDARAESAGAAT